MKRRRLKTTELLRARELLMAKQKHTCGVCKEKVGGRFKKPALDHCHTTGFIRDVLCINCNGIEGKVFNLARRAKQKGTVVEWLENLLAYYKRHSVPQHGGILHPTHKTEDEKRLARNKKARAARLKVKAAKRK